MNPPNTIIASAKAPTGMTSASTAGRIGDMGCSRRGSASDLADDALDQIIHLFEHRIGLLQAGAGGDHLLAGVVLERPFEQHIVSLHHPRLDAIGLLLRRFSRRVALGPHL